MVTGPRHWRWYRAGAASALVACGAALACGASAADARPNTAKTPARNVVFEASALSGGRLVVAGTARPFRPGTHQPCVESSYTDPDCGEALPIVARYRANGELDRSFGNARGYALLSEPDVSVVDTAVDSRRRILVLTWDYNSADIPSVTRLTPSGEPDESFGTGGSADLKPDFRPGIGGHPLALDSLDRLLIAGVTLASGSHGELEALRLRTDGFVDTSFGTDGVARIEVDPSAEVSVGESATVRTDGRILVAGSADRSSSSKPALAQFNPDGTPDPTFGLGGGIAYALPEPAPRPAGPGPVAYRATDVAAASDGGAIVGLGMAPIFPDLHGSCGQASLLKTAAGGQLDPEFGVGGRGEVVDCDTASGLALLDEGGAFVVGSEYVYLGPSKLVQARYTPQGQLGPRFEPNPMRSMIAGLGSSASSVQLLRAGTIVTVGSAHIPHCIPVRGARGSSGCSVGLLVAQAPDGSIERSFGTRGVATLPATRICADPVDLCPFPYRRRFVHLARRGLARDNILDRTGFSTHLECPAEVIERCRFEVRFSVAGPNREVATMRDAVRPGTESLEQVSLGRGPATAVRRSRKLRVVGVVDTDHQRPARVIRRVRVYLR